MIYQYLIATITIAVPALFGIAVLSWTRIVKEKITTIAIGSALGIAIFGTSTYAVGHLLPITALLIWTELAILLGAACWVAWKGGLQSFLDIPIDRVAAWLLFIFLILFSIIGAKLMIEREDGLYTGIINAYGDIGWHAAMITELASGSLLPPQDPIFAGHLLTYPFLANLISSAMVLTGASLAASMNVPAVVMIPLLLVLMYAFAHQYTASRSAAIITCLLFLFGGATFGFIRLPQDITQHRDGVIHFFLNLPARDYSGVGTDEQGFHFLNPITSLLLPQRAMLFGIPLVLCVLILIHPTVITRPYAPAIAGAMAGMLPLFHAHACIALTTAIVALFIASPHKKRFGWFILPALLIGIPELLFYLGGEGERGSFFRYSPGWMAGMRNHFLYWIQNTGLYIPVSLIALFGKTPRPTKALVFAGTFLFIIADIFLFAPWAWDNFKLFVFWLIFVLPAVALVATRIINHRSSYLIPMFACALVLLHMVSASLDIWKLTLPTALVWGEWTTEGIRMATHIREQVPLNTPILTAPVHNSPAALSGRTLILGYPAHVWSHGALPWNREIEVKEYFEGKRTSIEGITPRYILVGPQERSTYANLIIRPEWKQIAFEGPYTLFQALP